MNTTAAVAASPVTYDRTAREARLEVLAKHKAENGSMVNLTGNTWPLKGFLYTRGSLWSKETKTLQVPSCVHAECQAAIDGYAAAHPKTPKAPKATKIIVTPVRPIDTNTIAPVDTRPAIKGTATQATLCKRLANMGAISDTLVTDLLQAGLVESAANVVKALAIFNQEHANLLK